MTPDGRVASLRPIPVEPPRGTCVDLTLSDEDAELLRDVLDSVCRDLSYEIADTDSYEFRQDLKARRERLRGVLDELGGPLEDRPI